MLFKSPTTKTVSNSKQDKILLCLKLQSNMNKKYLHNQCPDSICSLYFPSSLQTQKLVLLSFWLLTLHTFSLRIPGAVHNHKEGEAQGSEKSEKGGTERDTAFGRLCTSHTENMHTRDEAFCCSIFEGFF